MKETRGAMVVLVLLIGIAAAGFAQSNEIIDDLLASDAAPLGHVAYLVYSAAGVADEAWGPPEALELLLEKGWLDASDADRPVNLGVFAHLVMTTFDMRGGVMYTLIPGPRYAAREFAFRQFATGNTSPYRVLSGDEVTHMLGRVLDTLGEREIEEVSE